MKRLTRLQRLSAIIGTGLLIAAASGSAFAMHMAEDGDRPNNAVRHMTASTVPTPTSPLPAPTGQPGAEVEFRGTVEVTSDLWVVGGRTVAVTTATEIKAGLRIGTLAKVHAVRQADGSLWAREISPAREIQPARGIGPAEHEDQNNGNSSDDGNGNGTGSISSNDNGNDDKGNINTNDDNGNDDTHHDANSNVNTNDDHGDGDRRGNENVNNDGSNDGHHGGQGHDNGH